MNKTYLQIFILLGIICAISFSVFVYLNAQEEVTPGWTDPIAIKQPGCCPSLLFHQGEFWLVFERGGDEGPEIAVICSQDGREWSSPQTLVKESAEDLLSPTNPQWLKRPDGEVWLVWYSGKRADEHFTEIVYCAVLEEDGTLSAPQMINSYDGKLYSFSSVTNTPDGGLVMLETYRPITYATFEGQKVPGQVFFKCVVQSTDENLEWTQPFLLSQTNFAYCVAAFLDDQETIWVVYEESSPMEGTYFRKSEDGITWSEPHKIPVIFVERFFQRHNHQYVLFFISNETSVYMMTSPDGREWSQPSLVATLDKAVGLDVTESDDGTLWMIIDGRNNFYVTQFSDQQYEEDLQEMKDFRTKNRTIACWIAIIIGATLLILYRVVSRRKE